jgi:ATP-dependent Clp protease ATP-binding subunit ClpC
MQLKAVSIPRGTLVDIEKRILDQIIGQDHVVREVSALLQSTFATITGHQSRPLLNMFFLGPTGVGKTELAQTFTIELFGSKDRLFRFNMSEFQTKELVPTLQNRLVRMINSDSDPKTILLDEMEKGHPDALDLLLQLLDAAMIESTEGELAWAQNCIFVLTSNIGASRIMGMRNPNLRLIARSIRADMERTLRPEFIGRCDENIFIFNRLGLEQQRKIAQKEIKKVLAPYDRYKVIRVTDQAFEQIVRKGINEKLGARPLRSFCDKHLRRALSNWLLYQTDLHIEDILEWGANRLPDMIDYDPKTGCFVAV